MQQTRVGFLGLCGALLAAGARPAWADTYPDRPVRLVIGFPPGGPSDVIARVVAQGLSAKLGQPVVVDNRPGADGNIAGEIVAKAAPDGYTLLLGNMSILVANPLLYPHLAYDPQTDFVPISEIGTETTVLVVNPALPVHSVAQLIAQAKAQPGKLNYASSGFGSPPFLATAMFISQTHVDIVAVTYKGAAPALAEVVSGQTQMMFATALSAAPFVKSGQVRALAVTSLQRAPAFPSLPTVAETLPGFNATTWHGLLAPAKTPPQIVGGLTTATVAVLRDPAIRQRLGSLGLTIVASTGPQFAALIQSERPRWAQIIKATGAHVE